MLVAAVEGLLSVEWRCFMVIQGDSWCFGGQGRGCHIARRRFLAIRLMQLKKPFYFPLECHICKTHAFGWASQFSVWVVPVEKTLSGRSLTALNSMCSHSCSRPGWQNRGCQSNGSNVHLHSYEVMSVFTKDAKTETLMQQDSNRQPDGLTPELTVTP